VEGGRRSLSTSSTPSTFHYLFFFLLNYLLLFVSVFPEGTTKGERHETDALVFRSDSLDIPDINYCGDRERWTGSKSRRQGGKKSGNTKRLPGEGPAPVTEHGSRG
jgi:hypothetical protein